MAISCDIDNIDIETEEPITSQPYKYRSPEFFYPKKFVTIKSAETHLDISAVSTIYHGTHLDDVKGICVAPNTATFVGKEKRWRLGTIYNEYEKTYSSEYCSYIVEDVKNPVPMTKYSQRPFGPFLWFGTSREEVDGYGPYCFEFQFKSALRKYLQSRGRSRDKTLCYRAGGTLVYKQEVTHIVIICCEDDDEYQSYPLIDATSTKYFKPPFQFARDSTEPPVHKKQKIEQGSSFASTESPYHVTKYGVLSYRTLPSKKLIVPAMALRSMDLDGRERHEHVALAFYLPHGITLQLTNQDGVLDEAPHDNYCIKSKGACKYPEFDAQYIERFND